MHRRVIMVGVFWFSMILPVIGGLHTSHAQLPSWFEASPRLVGEAKFRLLFFDIYHAALFAPDGLYDGSAPYALRLSYMRDVSSQTIVDTSLDEMRRQGIEASLNVSYVEVFGDEVSERATRPLSNRNDQPTRVSVSDR